MACLTIIKLDQQTIELTDHTQQACEATALAALCDTRLGRPEAARLAANAVLCRLQVGLAHRPAPETIDLRWTCVRVLTALGDARATMLLAQLRADVQARAAGLTTAADCDRLIQALPIFRSIVAAEQSRRDAGSAAHGLWPGA